MPKITPPSQQLLQIRRAVSSLPRKTFTGEQAAAQVREHLAESKQHLLQIGQPHTVS